MITFFGHSSQSSFDFNLDHPSNYDNINRYPLITAFGCYGGKISTNVIGISELFLFEPEAGASVFFAPSDAGALDALNNFGRYFFQSIADDTYGEGAALAVQRAIQLSHTGNLSTTNLMALEFLTYHGDPSYVVHQVNKPDYFVTSADNHMRHSPSQVTISDSEFTLDMCLI